MPNNLSVAHCTFSDIIVQCATDILFIMFWLHSGHTRSVCETVFSSKFFLGVPCGSRGRHESTPNHQNDFQSPQNGPESRPANHRIRSKQIEECVHGTLHFFCMIVPCAPDALFIKCWLHSGHHGNLFETVFSSIVILVVLCGSQGRHESPPRHHKDPMSAEKNET